MFSKINWGFTKLPWERNWDGIWLLCNEKLHKIYKYIFLYRIKESDSITINWAPVKLEKEFNSYSSPLQ